MAFSTKKDAVGWAKHHLKPTKYGNFYDPIEMLETKPIKIGDGLWKFEGRDDEWLDKIEAMTNAQNTRSSDNHNGETP